MTTQDLTERLRAAVKQKDDAAAAELAVILEALTPGSGVKQVDVARITGRSREHLRRLAREHGIGAGDER